MHWLSSRQKKIIMKIDPMEEAVVLSISMVFFTFSCRYTNAPNSNASTEHTPAASVAVKKPP